MSVVPLLRAANALIEAYMARYAPAADGAQPATPSAEELRELRHSLDQIGSRIAELRQPQNAAPDPEITRYIQNLTRLRPLLQEIQATLRVKRDALQQRRESILKAQAWTSSYKQML
jgi:isopropylmalate/homocitrate/citramalate synthase